MSERPTVVCPLLPYKYSTPACEDYHRKTAPLLKAKILEATVGSMARIFLSLALISAAAQLLWAILAEGHLLALPVVAVMLYEASRNLKGFAGIKWIERAPGRRL